MRYGILVLLLAGCEWVFPLRDLPDASDTDASDTELVCPQTYLPAQSSETLRFKFVGVVATWIDAETACVDDTSKFTHLATPDTLEKVIRMNAFVGTSTKYWVGAARNSSALGTDPESFKTISQKSVPTNVWAFNRPDDEGGVEFAASVDGTRLDDRNPVITLPYLCECDTQVIDDRFNF